MAGRRERPRSGTLVASAQPRFEAVAISTKKMPKSATIR
jgi:hypothetical protein